MKPITHTLSIRINTSVVRSYANLFTACRLLIVFALIISMTGGIFAESGLAYLVKDIRTRPIPDGSQPDALTAFGSTLFFTANDRYNKSLWTSDGTAEGTLFFKDTDPQGFSNYRFYLTDVDGTLFFLTDIPRLLSENGLQLWKSDGTQDGTNLVAQLPIEVGMHGLPRVALNNNFYFAARYGLWKSNGTAEGTILLKNTNISNDQSARAFPPPLMVVSNTLFFAATDAEYGRELWLSDGTPDGTVLVKDINPGPASSGPNLLYARDGMLFFSAYDNTHGYELWQSDGTPDGTIRVKDINPGPDGDIILYGFGIDQTLYFFANDGIHGMELWQSDGTAEGTTLVRDINPGPASAGDQFWLAEAGGRLFI